MRWDGQHQDLMELLNACGRMSAFLPFPVSVCWTRVARNRPTITAFSSVQTVASGGRTGCGLASADQWRNWNSDSASLPRCSGGRQKGERAVVSDVLHSWDEYNRTARRFPDVGGIVAWVERAATAHSDRPAVHTKEETLTYRQLMVRADAVAAQLVKSGVEPGSIVAVASSRTVHPYPAILGVLKAGCGYLPIDLRDPPERLRFILRDGTAAAVLARKVELATAEWLVDTLRHAAIPLDDLPVTGAVTTVRPNPERICYVIYTSGTTGEPKGVRITETNLVNFTHWFVDAHEVVAHDRLAQTAPLTFDPSVQQIFPAWVTGACLVPVPEHQLYDPFALMSWLASERISVIDVVTAQWHHWRQAAEQDPGLRRLPDLRWIVEGGETLYHHESKRWHDTVESSALVRNVYGPTEATINASETIVDPKVGHGQVSIGAPLPNYRLYVVDTENRLCPPDTTGELLIAGDGVAQGYQSAAATAKAFGDLQLPDGRVERVYRTGDLARLVRGPSGRLVLDFVGRMDTQVKIRGFRIELEEIEAVAKTAVGVRDAAVQVRDGAAEQLVCFYAADEGLDVGELRAHLSATLAVHQIPNVFLRLDGFPVTRNGKLDRAALSQALEDALRHRTPPGALPVTPQQYLIAEAWSEVLGMGEISVDEDFFALGGTSLLAVSLVHALRAHGLKLLPSDVFAAPTVRELADLSAAKPAVSAPIAEPLP
jgi:nonribosomal peptide synthetase protein VioG